MDAYDIPQTIIPTSIYLTTTENVYYVDDYAVIFGSLTQETDNAPISGVNVSLLFKGKWGRKAITDSNGEYYLEWRYDESEQVTISASWAGNTTHLGARATKIITFKGLFLGWLRCFIATATYGSEMAPEVQFLRNFRKQTVLTTFTGQQFMAVFNGIYYSFSPTVASGIASSEGIRTMMRGVLYPLIGILQFGEGVTTLFSFSADLGIIAFCLVVSALLSLVYLVPWALLLSYWKRRVVSAKIVRLGSYLLAGSLVVLLVAVAARSPLLTMASGAITVLVMTGLTTLVTTRIIMKRLITP